MFTSKKRKALKFDFKKNSTSLGLSGATVCYIIYQIATIYGQGWRMELRSCHSLIPLSPNGVIPVTPTRYSTVQPLLFCLFSVPTHYALKLTPVLHSLSPTPPLTPTLFPVPAALILQVTASSQFPAPLLWQVLCLDPTSSAK